MGFLNFFKRNTKRAREVVKQGYACLAAGDLEGLFALHADGFEVRGSIPDIGNDD